MIDGSVVAFLSKGSPIMNRLNTFLRLCQEGGLVEKYWTELNMDALLKSGPEFGKDNNSSYFVFSLSHIGPAFIVLLFGFAVSFIVFLGEYFHWRIKQHQYWSA
jgi:hypothetical protein